MKNLKVIPLIALALAISLGSAEAKEKAKAAAKAPVVKTVKVGPGVLDGKVFSGEMGKKGKQADSKNDLSFHHGKFRSASCEKAGFKPAAYTAKEKKGKVTFKSDLVNAKGDKLTWEGTVKGDTVSANATCHEKGKSHADKMWFKGGLNKRAMVAKAAKQEVKKEKKSAKK